MGIYKPTPGMTVPRFADVATFFRLPVVKDFKKTSEYWSNYSSDTRNKIRKAENNNIIVNNRIFINI